MTIEFLENEVWYGGMVHLGARLPIDASAELWVRLVGGKGAADQYSPLFLSNRGRILHSDRAFDVHFSGGRIEIDDRFAVELTEGFETLRGAHREAARRYFSHTGKMPDRRFFQTPQYNTWIELMYNQTEEGILEYARTLVAGGMPAGVLMIDEGWAPDYGVYDFDAAKFKDPRGMVDELHRLGFTVMLWVTPMISPDGDTFRALRDTELLLHDKDGELAVRRWWNGFSCVLDFSNPKTQAWFTERLHALQERYGVDGFKFDSGDTYLYRDDDRAHVRQEANAHTAAFNRFCEAFPFNELRNVWDCGGVPLICRLQDKLPQWDERGLGTLLPNMLTQGILGYFYGCPDMVGGGAYGAFLQEDYRTDEELYLRWLAASVLCPMMQFSISPKRILSARGFAAVQKLTALRAAYTERILALAENAAKTGEPLMRYLEYEFPGCGYEKVTDQFMLGSDLLVAPILHPGCSERRVLLPAGLWRDPHGREYRGGQALTLTAALDELILLERIG